MESSQITGLIESCLQGESEAFSPIIRQFQSRIYYLCRHFLATSQDAEDAVTDIFIKAYLSLNQYNSHYNFITWISRIAINHCLEKLRRFKLEHQYLKRISREEIELVEEKSPDAHYIRQTQSHLIKTAVKDLPIKYRTPLMLKYQEELTYQEIGFILDLPVNTVGSLILRGKKMLRVKINKMEKKS